MKILNLFLQNEVYRFNNGEIVYMFSDLDMMLSKNQSIILKSVGFYPKEYGKLELIDHLTFEKIR